MDYTWEAKTVNYESKMKEVWLILGLGGYGGMYGGFGGFGHGMSGMGSCCGGYGGYGGFFRKRSIGKQMAQEQAAMEPSNTRHHQRP